MKKQLQLLFVLIAANFFIFSSCNKSDDPPAPKTKTQLLTQGTWKFKSATASGIDVSSYLQTCQKDNILTFATNGTGTVDEGASRCNGTDPQINPLTWNFASNETILHISATLFSGAGNDFNLITLTETELVVSIGYAPTVGPIILIVVTFQH